MFDKDTGRTFTAPLKFPRLNEGAIPSLMPNCSSDLSSEVFQQETPESRMESKQNDTLTRAIPVCEENFHPKKIVKTYLNSRRNKEVPRTVTRPFLLSTAVPSIFSNCSNYLSKPVSYREGPEWNLREEGVQTAVQESLNERERMRDRSRRDKKCIVKGCSSTGQTTNESFFLFPRNRELAVIWADRLGVSSSFMDDGQLANQVVCGLHFPDTAFITTDRKNLVRGCLPTAIGSEPTNNCKSSPYIPLNYLPTVLTTEDDLHVTRPTTTYSKSSVSPQPESSAESAENTTLFTFEEEDVVVKEENLILSCSSSVLLKTIEREREIEGRVVSSPYFCPNCNASLTKIDAERPKSQDQLWRDGQKWLRPKDEREDCNEVLAQLEEEQQRNRELQAQLEVEQQQNKALQAQLEAERERSRELQAQLEVEQERSVGFVVQLDAEKMRCSELRSQIKRQSVGGFETETSQQLQQFLEAVACENNDIAIAAAKCGNTAAMKCLLAAGTDVEGREGKNGLTLLHLAAVGGHTRTVKCLLTAGAGVNAVSEDGTTPLHVAAYGGHKEVCEILLLMGACVNLQDITQACPLHKAAQQGHLPIVQLLLQHGANPNLKDCVGQTPHDIATCKGHLQVAVTLLS